MKHELLRNFVALDQEIFTKLLRHCGFIAGACYRIRGNDAHLVLGTMQDNFKWLPAITHTNYYTTNRAQELPLGFVKQNNFKSQNEIPKSTAFYFPEQELKGCKIFFVLKNAPGKRTRFGDLDGALEAIANRILGWFDESETRYLVSDVSFMEQLRLNRRDLQSLIDHEIRTPLSTVHGYSYMLVSMLGSLAKAAEDKEALQYLEAITSEANRAVRAVEKIHTMLDSSDISSGDGLQKNILETVDIHEITKEVVNECQVAEKDDANHRLKTDITFIKQTDKLCNIKGASKLIKTALAEVIKNACKYALHGQVKICLYRSDSYLVLDVEDDGEGVPVGTDELIFLRFFQHRGTKISKGPQTGLGIGLFLARYITEQHFGQLTFVRGTGNKGVFRFIWPVDDSGEEPGPRLESA